jgi:hypothetical protein
MDRRAATKVSILLDRTIFIGIRLTFPDFAVVSVIDIFHWMAAHA